MPWTGPGASVPGGRARSGGTDHRTGRRVCRRAPCAGARGGLTAAVMSLRACPLRHSAAPRFLRRMTVRDLVPVSGTVKVISVAVLGVLLGGQGRKGLCEEVTFQLRPEKRGEPAWGRRRKGLVGTCYNYGKRPGGDEPGGAEGQPVLGGARGSGRPGGGWGPASPPDSAAVWLPCPRHVGAGAAGDEEAEGGSGQAA